MCSDGFRAVPNHLVLLPTDGEQRRSNVSGPCRTTWFSYSLRMMTVLHRVSGPCRITWFSYTITRWPSCSSFQSRIESPGSLTQSKTRLTVGCFRAVPNHLVLLPDIIRWRGGRSFRAVPDRLVLLLTRRRKVIALGFRAVPDHLALLLGRKAPVLSDGFRAVRDHLVLLLRGHAVRARPVSEPCRITWFSYETREGIAAEAVSQPYRITWYFYCGALGH